VSPDQGRERDLGTAGNKLGEQLGISQTLSGWSDRLADVSDGDGEIRVGHVPGPPNQKSTK
jgi:hypothetical protein